MAIYSQAGLLVRIIGRRAQESEQAGQDVIEIEYEDGEKRLRFVRELRADGGLGEIMAAIQPYAQQAAGTERFCVDGARNSEGCVTVSSRDDPQDIWGKFFTYADARECAFSVNACRDAGISVEALEAGVVKTLVETAKQYDDLSGKISGVFFHEGDRKNIPQWVYDHEEKRDQVKKALAAIQPQEGT